MDQPQPNYDYSGIGRAEALLLFSALAASPWAPLTNGALGKFTFLVLCEICTWLANREVLILNVGATDLQVIAQDRDFNGTFDKAFEAIHGNPDQLTKEEKDAIDAPVIQAFRKFGVFGQLRNS